MASSSGDQKEVADTETAGPSKYRGNDHHQQIVHTRDEPDVYPSIHKQLRANLYFAVLQIMGQGSPKYQEDLFLASFGRNPAYMAKLKLSNCNASDRSVPFSDAYCSADLFLDEDIPMACIFDKGLQLLLNFLQEDEKPTRKGEEIVLSKLLHFVKNNLQRDGSLNDDCVLNNLQELKREGALAKVLANHFFGKLTMWEQFILDSHTGPDRTCPCKEKACQMNGYFADTSIGNKEVWHGSLDVVLSSTPVVYPIDMHGKGDADGSPDEKSPMEVKMKSSVLQNNDQIIAETIVFSFLQKQRHPDRDHFLFPCIGVTGEQMVIYFFDSEHDVLLETQTFDICQRATNQLIPLIISWLVVNHKYLCSGLNDYLKEGKSGFFSLAGEKLEIYKQYLQFGGVVKVHLVKREIGKLRRKRDEIVDPMIKNVSVGKFEKKVKEK